MLCKTITSNNSNNYVVICAIVRVFDKQPSLVRGEGYYFHYACLLSVVLCSVLVCYHMFFFFQT